MTSHGVKAHRDGIILVVDDDPVITKTLSSALRQEGFKVETAADGMAAFERIKTGGVACMLLDIQMPKISGVELLLLMQTEEIHVPTLVMASFDDFEEKEMKQFVNVRKYLPKPFELAEMTAAVRRIVG